MVRVTLFRVTLRTEDLLTRMTSFVCLSQALHNLALEGIATQAATAELECSSLREALSAANEQHKASLEALVQSRAEAEELALMLSEAGEHTEALEAQLAQQVHLRVNVFFGFV